jgi:transposase
LEKKLSQSAQQLQSQDANATVEVWCEDEHRLGLKPMSRRIWVEEGWQPVAQVNWRFQWLWLVGFVHPPTGETYWWIVPRIDTSIFNLVLADFAAHMGVGETKQILLAVDRAGWHLSGELKIPPGIHLELMPSHSPELQPAERLWPLTNEPIANRTFTSLDELEEVLFHRCRVLLHQTDLVRGLTNFYWWPQIAA